MFFGHYLGSLYLLPCTMNFKHNVCADLDRGCSIAKISSRYHHTLSLPTDSRRLSGIRGPVIVHGFCKSFKHNKWEEGNDFLRQVRVMIASVVQENMSRLRISWIYKQFPANSYLMETTYNSILEHEIGGEVPLEFTFLENYSNISRGQEDYCKAMLSTFHALMNKSNF